MLRLNVEVTLKSDSVMKSSAMNSLVKSELMGIEVLPMDSKISEFKSDEVTAHIESIHVCELESPSGGQNGPGETNQDHLSGSSTFVNPKDVSLVLHFHRLYDDQPQAESLGGAESETIAASYCMLPSRSLHGLWDTLIFDSDIKEQLLQYARTMLIYAKCNIDTNIISCNRVILLHGPPGTGKTSLCRSLAQKLSVRMSSTFSSAILVEINTHSLFSKYFSESGKLVSKMFRKITELTEDPGTLVFILIDEVESLTHSRAAASHGAEPSDSIRVVNAVLTHLDVLKKSPNVLVLTTSNITGAIDIAFVDRADIRAFIPNPSWYAIYCIYYSCLEELIKAGLVIGPLPQKYSSKTVFLRSYHSAESDPGSIDEELVFLSVESEGLSGRALRKVPLRVHSTSIPPEHPSKLSTFVRGMRSAVKSIQHETETISKACLKPVIV